MLALMNLVVASFLAVVVFLSGLAVPYGTVFSTGSGKSLVRWGAKKAGKKLVKRAAKRVAKRAGKRLVKKVVQRHESSQAHS